MTIKDSKHVLIILLGALGDVARGLFIAAAIKRERPDWHITWLVETKSQGLVELSSQIDRVIVFRRGEGLSALVDLYRQLRSQKFDISFDLQRHFKSGFFTFIARAKKRIGFPREDSKEFNWLFQTEYGQRRAGTVPKLTQYFDQLASAGIKISDHLNISEIAQVSLKVVASELSTTICRRYPQGYIFVVLSTSWSSKYWPEEHYKCLVSSLLKEQEIGVVLVGDSKDSALAESLCTHERVVSTLGQTGLSDLVTIISGARAGVGPDSGPGHISSLVGTPYVSIFGPTDPHRTAPHGSVNNVVKVPLPCSPCYQRVCPGLGTLCMRLAVPEEVMKRLRTFLV